MGSNSTGELTAIAEAILWLTEFENISRPTVIFADSKYAWKMAEGEFRATKASRWPTRNKYCRKPGTEDISLFGT